jgi:hypothetical protein
MLDRPLLDALALIGGITGPLGFVIALLVFYRDRSRIVVSVTWDMIVLPAESGKRGSFAYVTVANLGRRPAYVSHISARQSGSAKVILLTSSVPGKVLAEGSAPYSATIEEQVLKDNDVSWWLLRFSASTPSGELHYSPWLETPPKWASEQVAPANAALWNKRKNRFDRLLSSLM